MIDLASPYRDLHADSPGWNASHYGELYSCFFTPGWA